MMDELQLTECPRDAMQGIHQWIPTDMKIKYINLLLEVGFDVIDFGSFVSEKAVPQMKDTAEVLAGLNLNDTKSQLLAIIANERGAADACQHERIDIIGFPFSVSEAFQLRNTRSTRLESLDKVRRILEVAEDHKKTLLIYLSMGFGNPYQEEWSPEIVHEWTEKLYQLGIRSFSLSDTIGSSTPEQIHDLFPKLKNDYLDADWGMHLHTHPAKWKEKLEAGYAAGCRRFDGAINGYGGCPMASDQLTGNMPTELMVEYLNSQSKLKLNVDTLQKAVQMSSQIFP